VTLTWRWTRFSDLGADGVYDMLALRARVFILEQGPYLDPDGADRQAWHLLGRNVAGELVAYLRVVDPGVKSAEPSIGRVVVGAALRGRGAGHALVREGVARCASVWPGRDIRISAQAHLQRFYRAHGFASEGGEYLEDEIPHVQMRRRAS
jgi:ElaA protein